MHDHRWVLFGVLCLLIPPLLLAQPTNKDNVLAGYGAIAGLSASFNIDDHYSVVLAATNSGDVHEIFYSNSGLDKMPPSHGDSIIAHYTGIVGLAGFYNMDDLYRIAIVATNDGDIHEVFYHPTKGRGESVIAHYDGILSIAAFFNRDDKYRVVLVATTNGNVYEVFYSPTKGKGQHLLVHYNNLLAIAGTFFEDTNDRCLVALTGNGLAQFLIYAQ